MKGKLIKTDQGWMVGTVCYADIWSKLLPLHPDDVKQINADAQVFDNIEARIAAYPDVEFEMVEENIDTGALEAPYIKVNYAKLIKQKYPELEGTMKLCEDVIQKRTGKMTEEEWQAAERAQTGTKQEIYWIDVTGSNPVLTTEIKIMKNEKWVNGFLVGFFIGGILGIIILDLVQRGIL